jgi:hypothetical protein
MCTLGASKVRILMIACITPFRGIGTILRSAAILQIAGTTALVTAGLPYCRVVVLPTGGAIVSVIMGECQ